MIRIRCDTRIIDYQFVEDRNIRNIKDRFLKNTLTVMDYLIKSKALAISYRNDNGSTNRVNVLETILTDTSYTLQITKAIDRNYFNAKTHTIGFYDTCGIVFRKDYQKPWIKENKGFNSPALLLAHECIHCYNSHYNKEAYWSRKKNKTFQNQKIDSMGRDLSFPNEEEVFVTNLTNQVALKLQEDIRLNYGRNYYEVSDICSTKGMKNQSIIG